VIYVGATPIFADVDPQSWCLSAESLEQVIGPRTKAVIPVDLYGNMADMDAIAKIAAAHRLAVVEDAAESVGSRYRGRYSGTFGEAATFSFHGSKTLTTGEGGMVVTNRRDLLDRMLVLRDHGRAPGDRMFINTEIGQKYKMSALQAALGLAQVERFDELIERKREIFAWYEQEFRGVDGIALNTEAENVRSTYWMVTVLVDPRFGKDKAALIGGLNDRGVDCRPIFSPLSSLPAFERHPSAPSARVRNKVSYALGSHGVSLPSGFNLDRDAVREVVHALRAVLST
jgi:perosamine synthetase